MDVEEGSAGYGRIRDGEYCLFVWRLWVGLFIFDGGLSFSHVEFEALAATRWTMPKSSQ